MTIENEGGAPPQDSGPSEIGPSPPQPPGAADRAATGSTATSPELAAAVPRRFPVWLALMLVLIVAVQVALAVAVLRTGSEVAAVRQDVDALATSAAAAGTAPVPSVTGPLNAAGSTVGSTADTDGSSGDSGPVGFTEDGYPYRGNPDAAVTLIEYSDYGCPFCGRYNVESVPTLLERYVVTGDVRFVFRDFPLVALHPTAPAAHTAAFCAGEQGAQMYWVMHDAIFARQADWTGLADPSDFLAGLAANAGVDEAAYDICVNADSAADAISSGVAEARALGFSGTPSFQFVVAESGDEYSLVGAQPVATFQGYLDALLSGAEPPGTAAAPAPEAAGLPAWADPASGLQPDPDRPGVNLAGDYYRGSLDAQVVVIEFSDFECPFCREHALGSQPLIDEALVDTGEVMWVFKNLPLEIHPGALSAAVAAECAGDQQRFWEMHDLLFTTVARWAGDGAETDAELGALAAELELDTGAFAVCFDGREALQRVLADINDASGIISSTPSFVLIQDGRGTLLEGALPPDQFIDAIRAGLDEG